MARIRYEIDLTLRAFSQTVPPGAVTQYSPDPCNSEERYAQFRERILENRGYLPIYRMSDGEFTFICGKRRLPLRAVARFPWRTLKSWLRPLIKRDGPVFVSGGTGTIPEIYTPEEWQRLRYGYEERVAAIARKGLLAVNLVRQRNDLFCMQYIDPMWDWFESTGIQIGLHNYYPFYFVYALFLGPDATRVVGGREVLVVTADEGGSKLATIGRRLTTLGAKRVVFISISSKKSMMDRIDVSQTGKIDLVLIGAGVGALNILEQVESLQTTSIDVGHVLDCYWKPEQFVGQRHFSAPDQPLLVKSANQ